MKKWEFISTDKTLVAQIAKEQQIPHIVANILCARNMDSTEKIKEFLCPKIDIFHNPFEMKDMDLAVHRIQRAIDNKEKITIYGDYDVDGATSTALLYLFLKKKSVPVNYYIPNRMEEGYGLNDTSVRKIADDGTKLLITVDTGITAHKEVDLASKLGMDCVITDHHESTGVVPGAVAVIDPKRPDCPYPFKSLAGVGVVFKLICALSAQQSIEDLLYQYSDLVAIGTIADVMPLLDENRLIVKIGLSMLPKSNLGISTLLNVSNAKNVDSISTFDISFIIAPRMNAAGRIGNASLAVELLIEQDKTVLSEICNTLCFLNNKRQQIESDTLSQALEIIETKDILSKQGGIVLWHEDWHHGVVGIVSSRIKDRFCRPTILFSLDDMYAKGSGRTPPPLNLYETLTSMSDCIDQFGGHALAAGITVRKDNLHTFADEFYRITSDFCKKTPYVDRLIIDGVISEEELNISCFTSLAKLQPFGSGNEVPVICYKNATLLSIKSISNGKHICLVVQCGRKKITAFYFGVSIDEFPFYVGDQLDIAFQTDINEYKGTRSIQMIIKSIRLSEQEFEKHSKQYDLYISGTTTSLDLIDRKTVAAVFRFIKKRFSKNIKQIALFDMSHMIEKEHFCNLTVHQIVRSFTTLKELDIIIGSIRQDNIFIDYIDDSKKVNLTDCAYYCSVSREEGR